MSKEYHVFTNKQNTHEQAFVFEVDRDYENHTVFLKELWMITSQNTGELKTRILFDQMLDSIINTEGGNVPDETVETVLNVFGEVLGPEKTEEVRNDLSDKSVYKKSVEELILASELAVVLHDNGNIQSIVDELLSKVNKSNMGKNE